MNVPEYRHAVEGAIRRYGAALEKATAVLNEDLHKADCAFFEEQPTAAGMVFPEDGGHGGTGRAWHGGGRD